MTASAAIATGFITLAPLAGHAAVPEGEKLFQTHDCSTCHAIDTKIVGPAYVDVAKKYAGKPGAVEMLVKAVKDGHVGTWGMVPMPAHPNMPVSQIKTIVEWILTLK